MKTEEFNKVHTVTSLGAKSRKIINTLLSYQLSYIRGTGQAYPNAPLWWWSQPAYVEEEQHSFPPLPEKHKPPYTLEELLMSYDGELL